MYNKFYKFFTHDFVNTLYWKDMLNVAEDSPWHRENSVAAHTNMVLGDFETIQSERQFNDKAATVARFALLFHDVGKPMARTRKESVERGVYHSYPAHEQMSAREFEDYFMTNKNMLFEEFDLDVNDAYAIQWMIEYHLPYDTKKPAKRSVMASSVNEIENHLHAKGLFAAILRSDARGRISDDKLVKLEKVEAWIGEFYNLEELA